MQSVDPMTATYVEPPGPPRFPVPSPPPAPMSRGRRRATDRRDNARTVFLVFASLAALCTLVGLTGAGDDGVSEKGAVALFLALPLLLVAVLARAVQAVADVVIDATDPE